VPKSFDFSSLRGSRSGRFRAATVRATVRENQFMPVLAYHRSTCRDSRSNRASWFGRCAQMIRAGYIGPSMWRDSGRRSTSDPIRQWLQLARRLAGQ
jgi:hypothetical protein